MTNQDLIDEAAEAMRSLQAAVGQGRPSEAELTRVRRAAEAMSARLAELEADVPQINRIARQDAGDEVFR